MPTRVVIPILMRFYSLVSNVSVASRIKPYKGVHHPTKHDVINDVKMFPAVYRMIYCRKFLSLPNQKSRYKSKCIRMHFVLIALATASTYSTPPIPDDTTEFLHRRADTKHNVTCEDGLEEVDDVLMFTGNNRKSCEPRLLGEIKCTYLYFSP